MLCAAACCLDAQLHSDMRRFLRSAIPPFPTARFTTTTPVNHAELFAAVNKRMRDANGERVDLVAVSKLHPLESILAMHAATGHRVFGENYVDELVEKVTKLKAAGASAAPIEFVFIGRLQSKSIGRLIRDSAPYLKRVESLDSAKNASILNKELFKLSSLSPGSTTIPSLEVLIQVNTSGEPQKGGIDASDTHGVFTLARAIEHDCPLLRLRGLMTMGPDPKAKKERTPAECFGQLRDLKATLEAALGRSLPIASMGMSDDLEAAIACGSTSIRVGTALFGPR